MLNPDQLSNLPFSWIEESLFLFFGFVVVCFLARGKGEGRIIGESRDERSFL